MWDGEDFGPELLAIGIQISWFKSELRRHFQVLAINFGNLENLPYKCIFSGADPSKR